MSADIVEFLLAGFTDNSGRPLSGGKVYTYAAGTTTDKDTYTDSLGTTPSTNPIILDSNGRKQIYANGSYKFVIKTSADVTLYTLDNLFFGSGSGASFLGTTSGSGNTYTASPAPAISSYVDGTLYVFQADKTNTGAATLNISSVGAKSLSAIAGQIMAGFTYQVRYVESTDSFTIVNPSPGYASTHAQMAALNTAGVEIVIRQAVTLTGDLTLTAPLKIEKGGSITTNSNVLTINGPFTAGIYSCFSTSAGKVIFGPGAVEKVIPQWFGAVAGESVDCTTAYLIAVASIASAKGQIFTPPGRYKTTAKITGASKVKFVGSGDASALISYFSLAKGESMIHLEGTTGATTTLTADVGKGLRVLPVADASSFAAEDEVFIISGDWAHAHRIKSISGTNITLHEVVSYDWPSGATLMNGTWCTEAGVESMRFEGTTLSSEDTRDRHEDHGVNITKAVRCYVRNCSFKNLGSRAVIVIDKCGDCAIENNRAVQCYDRTFEIHAKTSGCRICDNIVSGGLIGCSVQGIGSVMANNTCTGCYGIDAGGTTRGSGLQVAQCWGAQVSGNVSIGSQREGMAVGSDVYYTNISNNTIAFSKRDGMSVNGAHINITNNLFWNNGDTSGDADVNMSTTSDINIDGNDFIAKGSPATYAIKAASAQTNLSIGINKFEDYAGALTSIHASTSLNGAVIGDGTGIKKVLVDHVTWNPGSIADGAVTNTTVGVSGAKLGDTCTASFDATGGIPANAMLWAGVTADDVVTVTLFNKTGGNLDLASGNLLVHVWKNA